MEKNNEKFGQNNKMNNEKLVKNEVELKPEINIIGKKCRGRKLNSSN